MSQLNPDGPKLPDMQPELQTVGPRDGPPTPETASHGMAVDDRSAVSRGHSSVASGAAHSALPGTTQSEQSLDESANRWKTIGAVAVVAAAVVVGIFGVTHFAGSGQTPPIVAVPQKQVKTFSVARADYDVKATDQLKALLAKSDTAESTASAQLKAINAPALTGLKKTSPRVAGDIESGRKILYRVYLLDFLDEDGDHVNMTADGVDYGDIYLKNAGTSFLIPLAVGKPASVKLTATADGGGGVTVGFISSLGEARTDVLQMGDSECWQIEVH